MSIADAVNRVLNLAPGFTLTEDDAAALRLVCEARRLIDFAVGEERAGLLGGERAAGAATKGGGT